MNGDPDMTSVKYLCKANGKYNNPKGKTKL